jgi:hypothetical protein
VWSPTVAGATRAFRRNRNTSVHPDKGVGGSLTILARTSVDEGSVARALRALLEETDPTVPVRIETMEDIFGSALAYPRFRTQLTAAFGGMALLLSALGIFSVLAYLVGQRTRELAVRRAVGAGSADVIRLVVWQGLRLLAFGLLLAWRPRWLAPGSSPDCCTRPARGTSSPTPASWVSSRSPLHSPCCFRPSERRRSIR